MSNMRKITLNAYQIAHSWGYLYDGELFAVYAISASLPGDAKMVNIGIGSGTSSMALRESNPTAEMWSIDISPGGPFGGLQNEKNVYEGKPYKLPNQILADSKEIGKGWHYGPLDLIFIDGDHSYDGANGDITLWWPHLKIGGYMLIHDYAANPWADVKRATDELIARPGCQVVLHVETLMIVKKV